MSSNTRTPDEDPDLIQSSASGDPSEPQWAHFAAWFGWRPSKAASCPRTAAGLRCRARRDCDELCICERWGHPLLDHPRVWLTKAGERVFTAEPYEFAGEDFTEFAGECARLGLRITVSGTSPYFPGRTCLIIIRPDKAAPL